MLVERKLSSKINYDVLRGLKAEDTTDDFTVIKTEVFNPDGERESTNGARTLEDMPIVYETGPTVKRTNKRCVLRVCFPHVICV